VVLIVLGVLLLLVALAVTAYLWNNATARDRERAAVEEAGFTERQATVDGHVLNYGEGPDNGPPLILVHGQGSQWEDHALVLPELAERHHVFAVDVPGHGGSDRLPADRYSNVDVATLLARFMEQQVGEPATVSGHSSGGLLALWIAAERPELVDGLLLEDPPLFSSELPRLLQTTGGGLPTIAQEYLANDTGQPFQRYFVEQSDYFAFFGAAEQPIADYSLRWIDDHPDEPLRVFFLPPLVSIYFEGLVSYDPAFGAAWTEDTWYDGFDTEASLAAVDVPTTLIHTNYFEQARGSAYQDGVLMAAMDGADVDRALGLLDDAELVQVASGHLVHYERAGVYLEAEQVLAGRVEAAPERPSVGERLEAAALDVFADRGLGERSRPIIEAQERLGTDEDDATWRAQGFPGAGVDAPLYSVQGSTDDVMATANLYELPVPRGADPCEVPWDSHFSGERPCDVVDEGSDQQIVIVGYTNLREIYLIDESWVLNLNVNGTTVDGELSDGPLPLTMQEQRSALLTIADEMRLRERTD
jgi:pimeloyl-ACP methyl ester carboxylesterase